MLENVKILGLSGAKKIAKTVGEKLKIKPMRVTISNFADGEILVRPEEPVRNQKIFVIQSLTKPVNESLMELLVCLDALKRANAREIVVLLTYYAYARQDRKASGREPISAKLVALLIEKAGANHVITLDVHCDQIQGFFEIPFDTLKIGNLGVAEAIKTLNKNKLCVVSPDYGCVKRAREFAKKLNCELAILDKRRPKPNVAEILNILGDVKGKDCLIIDDMIDTAGTICLAAKAIKNAGARTVNVIATHAILSGPAKERITQSFKDGSINHLVVSNTIPTVYDFKDKHVTVFDISKFVVGVIKVIFSKNLSLSKYANNWAEKTYKKAKN